MVDKTPSVPAIIVKQDENILKLVTKCESVPSQLLFMVMQSSRVEVSILYREKIITQAAKENGPMLVMLQHHFPIAIAFVSWP